MKEEPLSCHKKIAAGNPCKSFFFIVFTSGEDTTELCPFLQKKV
jgi:hypothetical protein